jgi:hypothetical protein
MIEDAVARGTGSVAEARALLTGAWIFSDGGRISDPRAIAFLQRAREIITLHPVAEIRSELGLAIRMSRELVKGL